MGTPLGALPLSWQAMSRRLITIAAVAAGAVFLASCSPPVAPAGALPVGMRTAPVPPVDANAYVYLRPPGNARFSNETLGVDGLTLESADVLLGGGSDGVAARFITSAGGDEHAPAVGIEGWIDSSPTSLRFGPDTPWGAEVRTAWRQQPERTFAEQFPAAWADLQAMPENPPAEPIAAGFVRNFGTLLEDLIGEARVSVPNLADGLSLVRINRVVFTAYSDDFARLPDHVEPSLLQDLNVSILAVAESTYPSAVVGQVFDGFVSSLGLAPVTIAGATAHQRNLADAVHVVVLRDGATLFFAIGATQGQATALIEAVVVGRDGG
jgi:hypothetical protein